MTRLTEDEREALIEAIQAGDEVVWVEALLAARSADMEARIRALHYRCGPDHMSAVGYCHECIVEWPCPTVAVLDVAPAGGAE